MIYVTSDLHFGHKNIIKHCDRPFRTVDEMNDALIEGWWEAGIDTLDDDVYVLGDFAMGLTSHQLASIFDKLPGRKHLILGNHDQHRDSRTTDLPWTTVSPYAELKVDDTRIVMLHYPIESWNGQWHGSVHLHGHCHGSLRRRIGRRFDVGVDSPWGFNAKPYVLDHLVEAILHEPIEPQDGQSRPKSTP